MLSITGLSYYLGGRALYENANFHLSRGNKIGLVGDNGTGKSTLFKLILGKLTPDQGQISIPKGYQMGWLSQDLLTYKSGKTIRNVVMEGVGDIQGIQNALDKVLKSMESEYSDELLEEMTKLQEKLDDCGGYEVEANIEKILLGLGFKSDQLDEVFDTFSGGWRMRALLGKLLLQAPDLLLLDEPTNHLDVEAIRWLEQYLQRYQKEIILISHDRCLLDRVTNMTVEVRSSHLDSYMGNYTFFKKERALRQEIQGRAYENQQKEIAKKKQFIDRFRAKASKASLVKSYEKALDRMDKIDPVEDKKKRIRCKFEINKSSGKQVVELEALSKSFGSNHVIKEASAYIQRGDRIGLIGENGKGKTTLLRMIAQDLLPSSGKLKWGVGVDSGYYAQHQLDQLNADDRVIDSLSRDNPEASETILRTMLGGFRFSNDDVYKRVKHLSGGEKASLALAKLAMKKFNFLLLDEPTNHLDMGAIDHIANALSDYRGTILFVSHDRHFVQKVANKVGYIEEGVFYIYDGKYDEYQYMQSKR